MAAAGEAEAVVAAAADAGVEEEAEVGAVVGGVTRLPRGD